MCWEWYEYWCYKRKVYYYRMQIVIRECQSIWALADILLTWFIMCDCVLYWTRILVIAEVITFHIDIWLRSSSPLFEIILCTCIDMRLSISWARGDRPCWGWWDVKIIIWARGDRPCGICLIYDSALRSSAQTRGDRLCRYMDLASPPWVMNSRCISEEYHVYTVERVLGILRHIISGVILHCISWHPSFLMIMCFIGGWKVLDVWLPLFDELDLVCCWYLWVPFCESCDSWIVSLLLMICNLLRWLLLSWVLCKLWTVRLGWFYAGCSCGDSVGDVRSTRILFP